MQTLLKLFVTLICSIGVVVFTYFTLSSDTTDIRPQQFRVLSQQDQFTSPSGFQSFTNDSEQQHQYHPADKISIDTDRQFLSPASYRRNFTEEQNIAAEQLASELVKTYGGQNSHRQVNQGFCVCVLFVCSW